MVGIHEIPPQPLKRGTMKNKPVIFGDLSNKNCPFSTLPRKGRVVNQPHTKRKQQMSTSPFTLANIGRTFLNLLHSVENSLIFTTNFHRTISKRFDWNTLKQRRQRMHLQTSGSSVSLFLVRISCRVAQVWPHAPRSDPVSNVMASLA